jgi:hypothetical protein
VGAWGYNPFENDDAADWIAKLVESRDPHFLSVTLSRARNASGLASERYCAEALAAAEALACLLEGKPLMPEVVSCPEIPGPGGMLDIHRGEAHGTQERDAG